MSKNYYQSANIVLTYDTWAGLFSKVNRIIGDMGTSVVTTSNSSSPDVTVGNAYVNGYFGASNLYVTNNLTGGTANTQSNLIISSAVAISNSLYVSNGIFVGNSSVQVNTTPTTTYFINGGVVAGSINSTSYSGTAANAVSVGGVSINAIGTWISGNSQTAYTNAVAEIVSGVGAVSVLNFGAKGDGVTDDTAAIQAAIDYAANNGITKVIFPGTGYNFLLGASGAYLGTYTGPFGLVYPFYRGIIQLHSNIHIEGSGARIFVSGGRTGPIPGIFYTDWWTNPGQTYDNIRIKGLEIDGNNSQQTMINYPGASGASANVANSAVSVSGDYISIPNANTLFPFGFMVTYTSDGSNNIGGLTSGQTYYVNFANSSAIALTSGQPGIAANVNITSAGNGTNYNFASNRNDVIFWQWSYAINLGNCSDVVIEGNKIHDWQGNAVTIYSGDNSPNYICKNTSIINNEVYNIYGQGFTAQGYNFNISGNYIHGDGYWVAGMDIEVGSDLDWELSGVIENNFFDFRDGLSPVWQTPQYSANSAQAQAARIQTRRAISFGLYFAGFDGSAGEPYNVFNEHLKNITVKDNTILQGTMDCTNFSNMIIENNKFYNYYEDLSGHTLVNPTCISFNYGVGVLNLRNNIIKNNIIESDLDGYGMQLVGIINTIVDGNVIRYCRQGGIRLNGSSGIFTQNIIENVGGAVTGQSDPYGSGFISYGSGLSGQLMIMGNQVRDTRLSSNTTNTAFSNTSVNTTSDFISISNANTLYPIGSIVNYTTNGSAIGGLTNNTPYYVVWANTVGLTLSNSIIGANVNFTSIGSGTHNIQYWGTTLRNGMYLNIGYLPITMVQDNFINNFSVTMINDVNNVIYRKGNLDGSYPPVMSINFPISGTNASFSGYLSAGNTTVNGSFSAGAASISGQLNVGNVSSNSQSSVNILAANGQQSSLTFFGPTTANIRNQISSNPDGTLVTQIFNPANGAVVVTPMSVNTSGMYLPLTNAYPILTAYGDSIHVANGYLYINGRRI